MRSIALAFFLLIQTATRACDVCGTAGNSQGLGILPQFYKHFVGLQYQYRSFSSTHPSVFEWMQPESSKEYYQTMQIWGKANIGSKWQVFGFLPYQYNKQVTSTKSTQYQGIGDVSTVIMATLLRTPDTSAGLKHILIAGGGIKAPTAHRNDNAGTGNAMNLQTGSGSWDFVANVNYTIRSNNAGINTEAQYVITTANNNYKYGNRLSAGIAGFYWHKWGNWVLQPQLGIRLDYALHDYDNYSQKWLDRGTGGYIGLSNAGLQFFYKRIGLQCNYALPVWQQYAKGNVRATHRFDSGLLYFF
ncbi:hypothetical protein CAP35_15495 [Chitinophagaceae bacterium IBVUCB1]|nr:hypothetical protein CAP35_15495 [Chitinophagaceae bacterium IBVUCB1]